MPDTTAETQPNECKKKVSFFGALLSASISGTIVLGAFILFGGQGRAHLAQRIADPEANFVMSDAQPADVMLAYLREPVRRAVVIPATPTGPYKGVVCAEAQDGTLELYSFGRQNGWVILVPRYMSDELNEVAPAFCKAAFAQLN